MDSFNHYLKIKIIVCFKIFFTPLLSSLRYFCTQRCLVGQVVIFTSKKPNPKLTQCSLGTFICSFCFFISIDFWINSNQGWNVKWLEFKTSFLVARISNLILGIWFAGAEEYLLVAYGKNSPKNKNIAFTTKPR